MNRANVKAIDTDLNAQAKTIARDAYHLGFLQGLRAYAHWKDGVEYVGTTGTTLREAQEKARTTWNYDQFIGGV